jgi:hypothetical protein
MKRGKGSATGVDLVFSITYNSVAVCGSWIDYRNDRLGSHFEIVVVEV